MTDLKTLDFDVIANQKTIMDGMEFMDKIPNESIKACFFDPQYRGILNKMKYGNEGKTKEKRRCELQFMDDDTIRKFITNIDRVLCKSGHLFLWIDKFHLCNGISNWLESQDLSIVDLIVWEKNRIGMGYRTRNKCEFMMVLQKKPVRAKGVWTVHNIPNIMREASNSKKHPHSKPVEIQKKLIEAVSVIGDVILDPAMGSGSVLEACEQSGRTFIGCDIV